MLGVGAQKCEKSLQRKVDVGGHRNWDVLILLKSKETKTSLIFHFYGVT